MTASSTRWNRTAARLLGTGLVVALTSGLMLTAEAAPGGDGHPSHRGGHMMGGPMMGLHSDRALDAINATTDQRAQIKTILDAAHTDLKAQREAGRSVHEQMRQLFTQPTVDARAVETLRLQMLAQHDQASKRMMQAMLEASRVLTPEQRAKLAEMAARRHANMERRGPPPK
jgi:periplasmic protein CpxP/Spy